MRKLVLLATVVLFLAAPSFAKSGPRMTRLKRLGHSSVTMVKGVALVGRGTFGGTLALVGEIADGVEIVAIGLDNGTGIDNGEYFGVVHKLFHGVRVVVSKGEDFIDKATGAVSGT